MYYKSPGKKDNQGRDPLNQTFRKFRSKTQWIGSVQPEKFPKNGSTFWGGTPFPVGPVGIFVEWIAPQDNKQNKRMRNIRIFGFFSYSGWLRPPTKTWEGFFDGFKWKIWGCFVQRYFLLFTITINFFPYLQFWTHERSYLWHLTRLKTRDEKMSKIETNK